MALWVTMKSGEVRKYNSAGIFQPLGDFTRIARNEDLLGDSHVIASIRTSEISSFEFDRPCEVTFQPNVLDSAVRLLLTRARTIKEPSALGKLAELARLLRNFNPQRRIWTR